MAAPIYKARKDLEKRIVSSYRGAAQCFRGTMLATREMVMLSTGSNLALSFDFLCSE